MSLDLTPRTVRRRDRKKYLQLADAIADAITDGHLRGGDELPSQGDIAEMVGVSKAVVQQALLKLEGAALIDRRNGVVARVADRSMVRVLGTNRYVETDQRLRAGLADDSSAFTRDHRISWDEYTIDLEIKREPATPKDRELLQLPVGAMVWRRYFTKYVRGVPVELQRSAISEETAKQCPWMIDRGTQPPPNGTQGELAAGGLRATSFGHKLKARQPSEQEKADLEIADVPVIEIERQIGSSDGRVFEVSRVIVDASRHEVVFGLQLPDDDETD